MVAINNNANALTGESQSSLTSQEMDSIDSDDENWYEDYLKSSARTSVAATDRQKKLDAPLSMTPQMEEQLWSGQVDAKTTAGSFLTTTTAATPSVTSTTAGATPSRATVTSTEVSATDNPRSFRNSNSDTGSLFNANAFSGLQGVRDASSTPLTAFLRTQTVEATPVPHSAYTPVFGSNSVANTASTTNPIVMAYPMNATVAVEPGDTMSASHSQRQRRQHCWVTAALVAIPIIVALLVGGGYCASGACRGRSSNAVAASAVSDPTLVESPVRTRSPTKSPQSSPTVAPSNGSESANGTNGEGEDASASFPTFRPTQSPQVVLWNVTSAPTARDITNIHDSEERVGRAEAIAEFINNITLSGRHIRYNNTDNVETAVLAEDLALQWLIRDDPAQLWPNSSGQFRLQQRYSLLTLWFQHEAWYHENSSSATTDVASSSWTRSPFMPWRNATAWLTIDECQWAGVTCQNRSRSSYTDESNATRLNDDIVWNTVVHLELNSNLLQGRLPADLALLTSLVRLDVHNNSITGSLPVSIGLWTDMQFFRVSNNSLSGTIPSVVRLWNRIYFASFHSNHFVGSVPGSICNASNLTYLIADCNLDCSCCHLCYDDRRRS